ncbi:hypothetical protein PLCT2_01544 [Planctomycetaceae bacterium]|nr:hypothetical protein PLCT2_01544 [Planctomycetaceae bacterium]
MLSSEQKTVGVPAKPKGNGPLVLGLTGGILSALTIAGAVFNHLWPEALWVDIWFAVSISGLVGFGTNWIAIKMLFHPRVRVLGTQGVIPARRADLARAVAATIEEHLISADRMHKLLVETGAVANTLESLSAKLPVLLSDPAARSLAHNEIRRLIQQAVITVGEDARVRLKKKMRSTGIAAASGAAATAAFGPIAGLFAVGAAKSGVMDPLVDKILNDMVEELQGSSALDNAANGIVEEMPRAATSLLRNHEIKSRLTDLVSGASQDLLGAIDVKKLIETELLAHDDAELEALIDRVASNELVFIQVIGGVLGAVAGLALIWPWLLAPFGLAFVVAWLIGRRAELRAERAQAASGSVSQSISRAEQQALAQPPKPALTEALIVEATVVQAETIEVATQAR